MAELYTHRLCKQHLSLPESMLCNSECGDRVQGAVGMGCRGSVRMGYRGSAGMGCRGGSGDRDRVLSVIISPPSPLETANSHELEWACS